MRTTNPTTRPCTIVQHCASNQLSAPPSSHPPQLPGAMPSLAPSGATRPPEPAARVGMPDVPTRAKPCQSAPNHANARHPGQKCKTNPPAKTAVPNLLLFVPSCLLRKYAEFAPGS